MYSNVMVTGGCGFIASNFLNIMKKRYPETHFVNIDKLDYCSNVENVEPGVATFIKGNVGNAELIENLIKEYKFDAIFHFAAQSHVDNSFENAISFTMDNTYATHVLIEACRQFIPDVEFIHFSTDCVFTGKKGNYSEKDFRDAKDLYGISKKNGEDLKKNNTLILRTSFIGHELFDNKSLLSWFLKTKQKNIQGYSKAFFSGLTNLEISKFIYSIIVKKNFYPGIFNLSGSKISKYELLKIINTKYKLNKSINKDEALKIDRSLLNKKIIKKFKFKNKSWNKLIDQMKNDFDIYKKNLY